MRSAIHSQYPITTDYDKGYDAGRRNAAAAIRGMKSEPGHSVSSVAGASTAPLPDDVLSLLQRARLYTTAREHRPTPWDESGPFAVFIRELDEAIAKATS